MALLSALALLASSWTVEATASSVTDEWRAPEHAQVLAQTSSVRSAAALAPRPEFLPLAAVAPERVHPRQSHDVASAIVSLEGSLPPTRRQYHRLRLDDDPDLPA
ncbi:MAG: hypothetical protein ABR538_01075 [Candidatus Binatia bacterium]